MNRLAVVLVALVLAVTAGVALWTSVDPAVPALPPSALAPATEAPAPEPSVAAAPAPSVPQPQMPAPRALEGGIDWIQRNEAGIALLKAGNPSGAVKLFESCAEANPDEPVFARNLAIALEALAADLILSDEEAERLQALAALERALELVAEDPEDEELRAHLLARLTRFSRGEEAEAGFLDSGSLFFQLAFDGDDPALRAAEATILDLLDEAYAELGELLGVDPTAESGKRIRVILMTRAAFDRVTGLGDWAGGAFDGTVRVPVGDLTRGSEMRRLKIVLRHELTHAFLDHIGGSCIPGWLNEGFAQRFEQHSPGNQVQDLQNAHQRLRGHSLVPLETLKGSLAGWSDVKAIGRAYAQSLSFVEHLERQYGQGLLRDMVTGCRGSKDPEETFQRKTGLELNVVLNDLAGELGH